LRKEVHVVVRFVYIGGIVDHHCLNFLFIYNPLKKNQTLYPNIYCA
jgi:hypothetical protein